MAIDDFFTVKRLVSHPLFALFLGFVYVVIGFLTANYFFPDDTSMAAVLFITVLVVPTVARLLRFEERIDRSRGVRNFLGNHARLFEIYAMLFLGIFVGYFLLGHLAQYSEVNAYVSYDKVFGFQAEFLTGNELTEGTVTEFVGRESAGSYENFVNLLWKNLGVAIVCFILSFFYGAGGVYLLIMNASIFSATVFMVSRFLAETLPQFFQILGVFSIHLVPEILGFLVAAVAGGLVSKALVVEKFGTANFRNVIKDSLVIFLISIVFIAIGAFLEGMVTPSIFVNLF